MKSSLHLKIFPEQQKELFDILSKQTWIETFCLVGGTSLALQIGQRRSIDFDFFTKNDFSNRALIEKLRDLGKFELFSESDNTIHGTLNNVRVSFSAYKYPLMNKLHKHFNLSMADILDIALMKFEAISGRGSKKDFIDLFFLLRYFSISQLLEKYTSKYGIEISNKYHLLKSLVYFEDAEQQPMPEMIDDVSWKEVKKSIITEIRKVGLT
jgi:hypothetical protein